jgi:hypothetical protein
MDITQNSDTGKFLLLPTGNIFEYEFIIIIIIIIIGDSSNNSNNSITSSSSSSREDGGSSTFSGRIYYLTINMAVRFPPGMM